jgi:hypothetical protein
LINLVSGVWGSGVKMKNSPRIGFTFWSRIFSVLIDKRPFILMLTTTSISQYIPIYLYNLKGGGKYEQGWLKTKAEKKKEIEMERRIGSKRNF